MASSVRLSEAFPACQNKSVTHASCHSPPPRARQLCRGRFGASLLLRLVGPPKLPAVTNIRFHPPTHQSCPKTSCFMFLGSFFFFFPRMFLVGVWRGDKDDEGNIVKQQHLCGHRATTPAAAFWGLSWSQSACRIWASLTWEELLKRQNPAPAAQGGQRGGRHAVPEPLSKAPGADSPGSRASGEESHIRVSSGG